MEKDFSRRDFGKTILASGAGFLLGAPSSLRAAGANDRLVAAVMGTNGRGLAHIEALLSQSNVEIAVICDVDDRALQKGLAAVARRQSRPARGMKDIRKVLELPEIDFITVAAPNHWHSTATILACEAGKHVYVEKPGSHDPHEGAHMVETARRRRRLVQMGTQRRSWPWIQEAFESLHSGRIGKVTHARTWYANNRSTIGRGKPTPVPRELDYALWQGPAPERPYLDNLVHYNWHWRWHWGNGELGNNGIHGLDLVRWGMQLSTPRAVSCLGGRYRFDDDQETPDTSLATFEFGNGLVTWEGLSCDPRGLEGTGFGVSFHGEGGSLVITTNRAILQDKAQKVISDKTGPTGDAVHFANFVDAIRERAKLNAPIEEGQRSTLLCHLGNIAWRTGETLKIDPSHPDRLSSSARKLWKRSYRKGWEIG